MIELRLMLTAFFQIQGTHKKKFEKRIKIRKKERKNGPKLDRPVQIFVNSCYYY